MTQPNVDVELYKTLGRIEQSVEDIRALMLRYENNNDQLTLRVASLERSRSAAKAWLAGALFVWTCLAGYVYQFVRKH